MACWIDIDAGFVCPFAKAVVFSQSLDTGGLGMSMSPGPWPRREGGFQIDWPRHAMTCFNRHRAARPTIPVYLAKYHSYEMSTDWVPHCRYSSTLLVFAAFGHSPHSKRIALEAKAQNGNSIDPLVEQGSAAAGDVMDRRAPLALSVETGKQEKLLLGSADPPLSPTVSPSVSQVRNLKPPPSFRPGNLHFGWPPKDCNESQPHRSPWRRRTRRSIHCTFLT